MQRSSPVPPTCGSPSLRVRSPFRLSLLAAGLLLLSAAAPAAAQTLTASWTRNTDPYTVGYRLYGGERSGGYSWSIDVGSDTSALLPDLRGDRTYYFSVRAYNAAGLEGPPSAEVAVNEGAPGAPTNLAVTTRGPLVTLTWDPPVEGAAVAQYLVSAGSAPGASDAARMFSVGQRLMIDAALPPGRYYARVQAANTAGTGPPSAEVSFTVAAPDQPGNPTNLTATWNGTVVTLQWTAGAGAAGYVIEAGSAPGAANIAAIRVGAVTTYSVDVPTGTFHVRVRSANLAGVSGPSNELIVQGRGAPGAPTDLSAAGTGSRVELRWSAPAGGPLPAGYVIEAGSAPGRADLARVRVGAATSFAATVRPGTYYVRIRAVNARGTGLPSNEIVIRR